MAPLHNELIAGTIQVYGEYYRFYNNGYTPREAEAQVLYSGGRPVAQSYGNVDEPFSLLVTSEVSADECVAKKRALELALNTARFTVPCPISLKPKEQTNTAYSEVYRAKLQEGPEFIGREHGAYAMRVSGMWTRAPFWGLLASGETVLNAASFRNRFTPAPDAFEAFSAGNGDLIQEGSPLNLSIVHTTSVLTLTNATFHLASYKTIQTDSTTQSVTTSSTTGVDAATGTSVSIGATIDANQACGVRLLALTSLINLNAQMRLKVYFSQAAYNAGASPIYTGPWRGFPVDSSVYDAGSIPVDMFKDSGLTSIWIVLQVKSLTGGSVTMTISSFISIYYYTWCNLTGTSAMSASSASDIKVRTFVETSGRACLPLTVPRAYVRTSSAATYPLLVSGTPPRYISGASLLFLVQDSILSFNTSLTFTINATHAPLYHTMRGAT